VTAQNLDTSFSPVGVTSHFTAPAAVYVVLQIRGVQSESPHTLSIRWSLNGHQIALPAASTSKQVTQNTNAFFSLQYPCRGGGKAEISWDSTLAQTVTFGLY
jgi:diketogulonate reductase-like aldo/keto reductase